MIDGNEKEETQQVNVR